MRVLRSQEKADVPVISMREFVDLATCFKFPFLRGPLLRREIAE